MAALDIRSNISAGDGTWQEPVNRRCSWGVLKPPRAASEGERAKGTAQGDTTFEGWQEEVKPA